MWSLSLAYLEANDGRFEPPVGSREKDGIGLGPIVGGRRPTYGSCGPTDGACGLTDGGRGLTDGH